MKASNLKASAREKRTWRSRRSGFWWLYAARTAGHQQRGPVGAAGGQRRGELRPVGPLAALHLYELRQGGPAVASYVWCIQAGRSPAA